jgi:hypothetical protein
VALSWYDDMEEFGKSKEAWLKTFLRLPGWIPSHDTFNRIFSALYPVDLEKGFVSWTQAAARLSEGEVAAIDGRSMYEAGENGNKVSCIWSVSGRRKIIQDRVR